MAQSVLTTNYVMMPLFNREQNGGNNTILSKQWIWARSYNPTFPVKSYIRGTPPEEYFQAQNSGALDDGPNYVALEIAPDFDPLVGEEFTFYWHMSWGAYDGPKPYFGWRTNGDPVDPRVSGDPFPESFPLPVDEQDEIKTYRFTVTGQDSSTYYDTWLSLIIPATAVPSQQIKIYGARLSPAGDDDLGIFSGNTPDTPEVEYVWTGTPLKSSSQALGEVAAGIPVTPAAPTFTDEMPLGYTIPATEGVNYKAGGAPVDAGTYPAAWEESVTITAHALNGYDLEGTASWVHTFPAAPIPATPVAPIFTEAVWTDGGTYPPEYVLPNRNRGGVRYVVGDNEDAFGRYTAALGETVQINAHAREGYVLTGTTEWIHTFASAVDLEPITPAAPTFDDDALEYTIPSNSGVEYKRRTSAALSGGTYPAADGANVRITATLAPAYEGTHELVGITVWEHQFPDSGPGPDPDPGEDEDMAEHMPGTKGVARRVMHTLGLNYEDPDDLAMAQESVSAVGYMVKAYTRGIGFTEDKPEPEILSVWITASTRLLANPSGLTYRAGTEWVSDAFKGWTLAEQFTLNNYRKRWN